LDIRVTTTITSITPLQIKTLEDGVGVIWDGFIEVGNDWTGSEGCAGTAKAKRSLVEHGIDGDEMILYPVKVFIIRVRIRITYTKFLRIMVKLDLDLANRVVAVAIFESETGKDGVVLISIVGEAMGNAAVIARNRV
jgi:hypothetical protein